MQVLRLSIRNLMDLSLQERQLILNNLLKNLNPLEKEAKESVSKQRDYKSLLLEVEEQLLALQL